MIAPKLETRVAHRRATDPFEFGIRVVLSNFFG
jgi:hypothetical protein